MAPGYFSSLRVNPLTVNARDVWPPELVSRDTTCRDLWVYVEIDPEMKAIPPRKSRETRQTQF
jgi:hypothetical protein